MRTSYILITIILLSALMYSSCVREDPLLRAARNYFSAQELFGVYQDQMPVFIYDAENHQLADNKHAVSFRIQTDSQNKMLHMKLNMAPELGQDCVLSITTKGFSGLESSYAVTVLKVDETKKIIWLWHPAEKMGFVMYYRF